SVQEGNGPHVDSSGVVERSLRCSELGVHRPCRVVLQEGIALRVAANPDVGFDAYLPRLWLLVVLPSGEEARNSSEPSRLLACLSDFRRPPPSARLETRGDLGRYLVHRNDIRSLALRVRGEHTISPGHARRPWADTRCSDGRVLVRCSATGPGFGPTGDHVPRSFRCRLSARPGKPHEERRS